MNIDVSYKPKMINNLLMQNGFWLYLRRLRLLVNGIRTVYGMSFNCLKQSVSVDCSVTDAL